MGEHAIFLVINQKKSSKAIPVRGLRKEPALDGGQLIKADSPTEWDTGGCWSLRMRHQLIHLFLPSYSSCPRSSFLSLKFKLK